MLSTNLSETLRSTVLTVSLTASVAVFRVANDVEKALGAKATLRVERIAVRAKSDILILYIAIPKDVNGDLISII